MGTGDKSYVDQAKDALGSAQQKASEALGSAKETLTGTVNILIVLEPCMSAHGALLLRILKHCHARRQAAGGCSCAFSILSCCLCCVLQCFH